MAYSLSISSSQSQDAANNRSTVGATLTLTATNIGYSGYNTSWGMSIGGTGFGGSGPTALNTDGAGTETWSVGNQVTYNHNADGTRGDISCYASFNGSGGYSPPYMEAGPSTQGALNYTRTPNTPPAPTLTRDGASITMSSAGTVQAAGTGGNPPLYAAPAIDYYHWYWGTDASTPTMLAQATSPYTHTTFTKTQAVYISTYAHNSEGFGPESGSTYIAGAPTAPAAPSMTRNTNNGATITVGWSAPANNGAGIDNYHVYLRENGGTYAGPYATTGLSYTFNSLTNTSTYGAIVYAHNSSGWSDPSTESSIVGVPTQPSSITVPTPVGLATTVSWGTSTNGTISNYYVSASSDNGATWQTEIAKGTATSHPFTGLNGGANYKFRVRAQNQIGYSTYVTSGTVFVASGGKVFNGAGGAGWNAGQIARRYDSSVGWTPIVTAKRWDQTLNGGAGGWQTLS